MRKLIVLLLPLLLLGCISLGSRMANVSENETGGQEPGAANATPPSTPNMTNLTNQTSPPPEPWERYNATGFSFEYPAGMALDTGLGIFTGTRELQGQPGQTGEIMIVSYLNTTAVYGANRDASFRAAPSQAAADFLAQDRKNDPAGVLQLAYEIGDMATFGIARDAFAAEVPFKVRFSPSGRTYSGYALDVYIPERSLHAKVRILAIDEDRAKDMRDRFLLGFRVE